MILDYVFLQRSLTCQYKNVISIQKIALTNIRQFFSHAEKCWILRRQIHLDTALRLHHYRKMLHGIAEKETDSVEIKKDTPI